MGSLLNQQREPLIEDNYKKQNEVADQLAKHGYWMHDNMIHFTVSPLLFFSFQGRETRYYIGITQYSSTIVCNESKSLYLSLKNCTTFFLRAPKNFTICVVLNMP